MLFSNRSEDLRQFYYASWDKYQRALPLSPLEDQIVAVIATHPEFHRLFKSTDPDLSKTDFSEFAGINPFLHMGLHLAVQDQIRTNRPLGIQDIYQRLLKHFSDQHETEHWLMEQLHTCLTEAKLSNTAADEQQFLNHCKKSLTFLT